MFAMLLSPTLPPQSLHIDPPPSPNSIPCTSPPHTTVTNRTSLPHQILPLGIDPHQTPHPHNGTILLFVVLELSTEGDDKIRFGDSGDFRVLLDRESIVGDARVMEGTILASEVGGIGRIRGLCVDVFVRRRSGG
ncbi:hypothetical protein Drorol1_Dr00000191 [Drosera rotundifolia]